MVNGLEKPLFTIFTPTFNRASTLSRLYMSLKSQTIKDFEWLLIDDGSTDNTEELVNTFISEKEIKIRYYKKQKNEGLYKAFNLAIKLANGELFFIVGSDDYLPVYSLERCLYYWEEVKNDRMCVGIGGLKGYSEDKIVGTTFKGRTLDATSIDLRYRFKIKGDKAEILRTEILRNYLFPEIEGVKHISPNYILFKIANDGYYIHWFNEIVYCCEYRSDGITRNITKISKENWEGVCVLYNEFIKYRSIPVLERIKFGATYFAYGLYGRKKVCDLIRDCNNKFLLILSIPVGLLKLYFLKK